MKRKIFTAMLIVGFLALALPTFVRHSQPQPIHEFDDLIPILEAQTGPASNTPPIVIPSNLGTWGNTSVTGTTTANPIGAPSTSTLRYYVDQVQCFNTGSTATVISIFKDGGPATSTAGYAVCPPAGVAGGLTPFYPPLQLNANATVTIKASGSSSTEYINVHAYTSR